MFIVSIISAAVYIHIYRLFKKLENMDGTHLLYQFTPIHSLLTCLRISNTFSGTMFIGLIVGIRYHNDSSVLEYYLATSLQTYGTIMFLINNFLFICLILYKLRKKSDENYQNFHEPIFNQLFYNSAFWLVATDLCFLIAIFGNVSDDMSSQTIITILCLIIETFLMSLGSILFAIIGIFSFLAAIQRIAIFYLPKYKFLVTGSDFCSVYKTEARCSHQFLYIYSFMIFIISIISAAVYIHIYLLFRKLENTDRGTYLLYQFTPIHSLLMVRFFFEKISLFLSFIPIESFFLSPSSHFQFHSVAHLVGVLLEDYFHMDVDSTIKFILYFVFVFNIPGVVSLSYIDSQRNFRNIFLRIAYPIWREISS
ncbi:hypothetical protein CRE_16033 [Caenorhabditis remanei]|uniref:Uncharacterized protein n=1 Tax=Caenorhabditis remanei TaxID=31234 RepID=E3MBG2_CAERE|nr:hypothetical protein CRE_16033 [Caenorhabditis remanei]